MDDAVSTLVTAKTTVIPKSSRSTSRLSSILERLSDDKPLSSSGSFPREAGSSSRPPSKASLIIQAARKRDTDCQTSVSIEPHLDIEFITRDEISAIQRDRDELETLLQTSLNSAVKMKEKHDAVVQENNELKEALDILQNENQELKEQVDELKDMMRELRRLQKEQLMEASAHRTFGGPRRMVASGIKDGSAARLSTSASFHLLDGERDDPLELEDPHFDDDEERERMDKLASMFQKLNDSCEATSSNAKLFDSGTSLLKSLQTMKERSKDLVQFDRDCRSHESKMVHDVRTLAEQAVALLVETEAAQNALKEAYGNVEFVPKQEVDPYKINVKVAERDKRRRRPGSASTDNSTSTSTSNEDQVDFLFGSPSHRYPVSPARGSRSGDDESSGLDSAEHRLTEHPDEDVGSSDEEREHQRQHQQEQQQQQQQQQRSRSGHRQAVDAIAEADDEDREDDDSLNDDDDDSDRRQRRKLRFEDEQDRDEGERELTHRSQQRYDDEDDSDRRIDDNRNGREGGDAVDGDDDDDEMTEEEYLYYLQLEREQQEAELRRRQQEADADYYDDE